MMPEEPADALFFDDVFLLVDNSLGEDVEDVQHSSTNTPCGDKEVDKPNIGGSKSH
jgi:hypothetical protein